MSELQVKPVILVIFSIVIACVFSLAVFAYKINDSNILVMSFLAAAYLIFKIIKLKNESLKLVDDGVVYNGELILFTEIICIERLYEEKYLTRNYKIYLLGNSSIYFIKSQNKNIQILSKLFKNADLFMSDLAKKSGIDVTVL